MKSLLLKKLLFLDRKTNKQGFAFIPLLWAGAALTAGVGYLITVLKPAQQQSGAASFMASVPIWGWVAAALVILILLRR